MYSALHDRSDSRVPWASLVAASALVAVGGYYFATWVQAYGWEGALSYIWEGDPYPQERERLDQLDRLNQRLMQSEKLLQRLESALETVRLNTIDDATPRMILDEWQRMLAQEKKRPMDLRTRLGLASSDLDKLAGQVDGVLSGGSAVLQQRKRQLSQTIVQDMARVDALIQVFQQGEASST